MALTIVLGLTILSVANYGNTYEFTGFDPSVQIKSQLKPTLKPFSTLSNQPYQGDQFKSSFGQNSVPPKPFGAPFDHFKPSYQPYQPFRTNYQPFGPYPGYPGPVVYPNHGGYQGPEAYRFNEPNHKPFGFQPFPAPAQPAFNQYKFGPSKKFNKNFPGLADFNQPGKYFQEHQFGAYHGPEFSSAIVPAEHNIKQSKPKDTLLGKPVLPTLPQFGLTKQTSFGFPSPPSFGYPVPHFPPVQHSVNAVSSVKSVPVTLVPVNAANVEQKFGGAEATTSVVPSSSSSSVQDESATVQQQSAEVTSEPSSATPAADAQPTVPAQEVTAVSDAQAPAAETAINNEVPAAETAVNNEAPAAETAVNNEAPAAEVAVNNEAPAAETAVNNEAPAAETAVNNEAPAAEVAVNNEAPAAEVAVNNEAPAAETAVNNEAPAAETTVNNEAPAAEVAVNNEVPAAQEPAREQSAPSASEGNEPSNVGSEQTQDSVQEPSPIVVEDVKETSSSVPAEASNDPSESSTVSGQEVTSAKSESVIAEDKPATESAAANLPGLPVELQNTQFGAVPLSDPSSLGQFGLSGFPSYFGQSAGVQQPSYYPYFDTHSFSEEELKAFAANFASRVPQSGQAFGSADSAVKITEGTALNNPSAEIAAVLENATDKTKSGDKVASDEKKTAVEPQSPIVPKVQTKLNSVQIIQNDPFNGQFPLLYDPKNAASPLDTHKFYNHPSVSGWSSQASLASYSPESAFNNFGAQFHQGYLVEGSPTLTPLTKTVVQSGQTPISISSLDHPLHSQVFKYPQSFMPYPGLVAGNNNAVAFQSFDVPSSTATPASSAAAAAAADVSDLSTSAPDVAVRSAPPKKTA